MQTTAIVDQVRAGQTDTPAAQLSYRIRDSLNTILLSVELLAHPQQPNSEKQQEYCQCIHTAVQQLTELLEMTLEQ